METVAVCDAPGFEKFRDWLRRGYHGSMSYLEEREHAYQNPRSILSQAKTVIMLAVPYTPAKSLRNLELRSTEALAATQGALSALPEGSPDPQGLGLVAAYATGEKDYHDIIHSRLKVLKKWIQNTAPGTLCRGVVDTAPILERDFAAAAGLGWIGKNTLLLRRDAGSYFFLAALLTDAVIKQSTEENVVAFPTDYCGTCTACLDACPTQAFTEPRVLDATKCISYLTIEHRGSIDVELREKMGSWILGCDVCQQVCPWNRMAVATPMEALTANPSNQAIDLVGLLEMSEQGFRTKYRSTPVWRPKLTGMQRNAMIALANQNHTAAIEVIRPFLQNENSVLSETASWAIAKMTPQPSNQTS